MPMITLGGRILIVGTIVGLTAAIAYLSPFPGYARVTVAMIGVSIAFVVGDRLRAQSELLEYEAQYDAESDPEERA